MKSLQEIYNRNIGNDQLGQGDKGTIHSYIEVYEKLFNKKRNNIKLLEIGINKGNSLRMWNEYFINSEITGIDISDDFDIDTLKSEGINIILCDATSKDILNFISNYDIIIDDGSHILTHQIESFNLLKERVNKGGLYIIEDIDDIDANIVKFKSLHSNCEIIDNRNIKGRFDDVLIIYKF